MFYWQVFAYKLVSSIQTVGSNIFLANKTRPKRVFACWSGNTLPFKMEGKSGYRSYHWWSNLRAQTGYV